MSTSVLLTKTLFKNKTTLQRMIQLKFS